MENGCCFCELKKKNKNSVSLFSFDPNPIRSSLRDPLQPRSFRWFDDVRPLIQWLPYSVQFRSLSHLVAPNRRTDERQQTMINHHGGQRRPQTDMYAVEKDAYLLCLHVKPATVFCGVIIFVSISSLRISRTPKFESTSDYYATQNGPSHVI